MDNISDLERLLAELKKQLAEYESGMVGKLDPSGHARTKFEIDHIKNRIRDIETAVQRQRQNPSS
jgi:hypothetical protein